VTGGLAGILAAPELLETTACGATCNNHVRYLSGLLLGIGLVAWSLVPRIERTASTFQTLTVLVVIGGLARLSSLVIVGPPNRAMIAGLIMELVVTPSLCVWQRRVIKRLASGRR
jgi:hypothetical protein